MVTGVEVRVLGGLSCHCILHNALRGSSAIAEFIVRKSPLKVKLSRFSFESVCVHTRMLTFESLQKWI